LQESQNKITLDSARLAAQGSIETDRQMVGHTGLLARQLSSRGQRVNSALGCQSRAEAGLAQAQSMTNLPKLNFDKIGEGQADENKQATRTSITRSIREITQQKGTKILIQSSKLMHSALRFSVEANHFQEAGLTQSASVPSLQPSTLIPQKRQVQEKLPALNRSSVGVSRFLERVGQCPTGLEAPVIDHESQATARSGIGAGSHSYQVASFKRNLKVAAVDAGYS